MEKTIKKAKGLSRAKNRPSGQSPDDAMEESRREEEMPATESSTPKANKFSWNEEVLEEEMQTSCANKSRDKSQEDRRGGSRTFSNSNYKNRDRDTKPYGARRSEPFRGDRNEDRKTDKRLSNNEKERNWRGPRDSSNGQRRSHRRDPSQDREFSEYQTQLASWKGEDLCMRTKEVTSDLFDVAEDYCLAHCVAEDMNMSSGIAVAFRYKFKRVGELLNQSQRTGGLAVLDDKDRFIYYLVTKKFSSGKPTYATLFSSLKRLRDHVRENKVGKLAMPRIGCGLDRLEWSEVKFMIEFLFREVDIDILVCNLEPTEDSSPQQKHRNCKVTHEKYPIQDIESGTVVLYFASEDEHVSDEMQKLDEKFNFLREFKTAKKSLGNVVFYSRNAGYLLCGCVVKKTKNDCTDYVALQKCLTQIQKENKKHEFYYYAFQAMVDRNDFCINYKIINILRNSLRDVEVYVCWPGDLQNEMAPRDRFEDTRDSFSKARGPSREDNNWRRKDSDYSKETKFQDSTPVKDEGRKELNDSYYTNWPTSPEKSTPVKDDSRKDHNDSFYTKWDTFSTQDTSVREDSSNETDSPRRNGSAAKGNSDPVAPDPNDSFANTTSADDNNTDSKSGLFATSSGGGVETVQTNAQDVVDHEYESFQLDFESGNIDLSELKEQTNPKSPKDYSRVCYVRENLMIDGGIPSEEDIAPVVGKLLNKREQEGLVWEKEKTGFLYCLVISPAKSDSVFHAIQRLRDHAIRNQVKKIAIPVLENLEGLKWEEVKAMFAFLLGRKGIEAILAPLELLIKYDQPSLAKRNKIKLAHKKSGIHQTPRKSVVIYLASMDGHFTEEMTSLSKKFEFSEGFKKTEKLLGKVIRHKENEDHVLYGCIVKETSEDAIDFEAFRKCLLEVKRLNTEKLPVVGIQAVKDNKEGVNEKIITILLHCLQEVTLHVCWPGDLKALMPKS